MFHFRLIPAFPSVNPQLQLQLWSLAPRKKNKDKIWNALANIRFTFKQKWGKQCSSGQAVPCENVKHMGDAQIWKGCSHSGTSGVISGGKKSLRAITFSCSASSLESLNIRPFSLCFTSSCKLWKKKGTEGELRQKAASGTFPVLHSDIQRDQTRVSVSSWPQMSQAPHLT